MKGELALENLREVKKIFDELGIEYWLDWGTLLGAVRDGKIIEWDHDIDLGTMDDSWEKLVSIRPELEKRGFYVVFRNVKMYKNVVQREIALFRFGCPIGIFLYQVKGEYALRTSIRPTNPISWGLAALRELLLYPEIEADEFLKLKFIAQVLKPCLSLLPPKSKKSLSNVMWPVFRRSSNEFDQVTIPKHYFEKLGTKKFYGMTFNIPSDVESYLELHYGKDWKTPKKEWDHPTDDGTLRVLTR